MLRACVRHPSEAEGIFPRQDALTLSPQGRWNQPLGKHTRGTCKVRTKMSLSEVLTCTPSLSGKQPCPTLPPTYILARAMLRGGGPFWENKSWNFEILCILKREGRKAGRRYPQGDVPGMLGGSPPIHSWDFLRVQGMLAFNLLLFKMEIPKPHLGGC